MSYTFSKKERLSGKTLIQKVAENGTSFNQFPFRTIWLNTVLQTEVPVQILFAVPKSNFKKAVQRNRIRRRMKEAYRKQKQIIYTPLIESKKQIAVMLVYTSKKEAEYADIEKKLSLVLQRLCGETNSNSLGE